MDKNILAALRPTGQFENLQNVSFSSIVSAVVTLLLIVSLLAFFFMFMFGGIKFIISGGNKEKTDTATRQIKNAFIGLFIVFSSWAIVQIISTVYGIDLLLIEIPSVTY